MTTTRLSPGKAPPGAEDTFVPRLESEPEKRDAHRDGKRQESWGCLSSAQPTSQQGLGRHSPSEHSRPLAPASPPAGRRVAQDAPGGGLPSPQPGQAAWSRCQSGGEASCAEQPPATPREGFLEGAGGPAFQPGSGAAWPTQ